MLHHCSQCPFFSSSFDELSSHIVRRHKYCRTFLTHCSICGTSFKKVETFRQHYYRRHFIQAVSEQHDQYHNYDVVEHAASHLSCSSNDDLSKKQEGLFLLKMKACHRLTNDVLAEIMFAMKGFVRSKCQQTVQQLASSIDSANSTPELSVADDVFDGLETNFKQAKFFEEHFSYVKPVAVKLGDRDVVRNCHGEFRKLKHHVRGYCVPFLTQLCALLGLPEVQQRLKYQCPDNSTLMTDIAVLE